ncbi:hypothetical protein ACFX2I_022598 [Malus domestica]
MRAILEFGRWFSLVYTKIITDGWKLYYVQHESLVNMINILYGEGIQTLLSQVQSNESAVIWFLTSDSSSASWIRHVCSIVDQRTNPFDGVPKCFDYWKGLADLAPLFAA